MPHLCWKKRLVLIVILVVVPYTIVETVASCYAWVTWWDQSFVLVEDTGTFTFDPVCGYRVGSAPFRVVRITNGQLEFVGLRLGNAQGFCSWYDFGPERPPGYRSRIAVFGDSFTDAYYLAQSWPDRVEHLARVRGEPIQLLNFAQFGAGLANWWSIIKRYLDADRYQIDGVIFAVWESDLQ